MVMDKIYITEALEEAYGTSNPQDVDEYDRWQLYVTLKSQIKTSKNPDDYTRQVILIAEVLEL